MPDSITLDRTDLRILEVLQREGRITNAELAERVSLSPSPCLRRLQRLEQTGVIAGYTAYLDPKRVGLGLQAFVRIQLEQHDAEAIARLVERVASWAEYAIIDQSQAVIVPDTMSMEAAALVGCMVNVDS